MRSLSYSFLFIHNEPKMQAGIFWREGRDNDEALISSVGREKL